MLLQYEPRKTLGQNNLPLFLELIDHIQEFLSPVMMLEACQDKLAQEEHLDLHLVIFIINYIS